MKTFTQEELSNILKNHERWLNSNGAKGERANLSGACLIGADLREADLNGADLREANLSGADLREANLRSADLREANLSGADLREANLSGADLREANLSGADLREACLIGADLRSADLREANLRSADLSGADLREANLSGADLREANLYRADLSGAKINYPIACPEEGSFIGFKKACMVKNSKGWMITTPCIVKLEIPEDALRSSATSRKCRCSKAKVLSITNLDGTDANVLVCYSKFDNDFIYRVGETVEVPNFDPNRWNECSTGIHFFITRQEAVEY